VAKVDNAAAITADSVLRNWRRSFPNSIRLFRFKLHLAQCADAEVLKSLLGNRNGVRQLVELREQLGVMRWSRHFCMRSASSTKKRTPLDNAK
jgi:hypothetical protein